MKGIIVYKSRYGSTKQYAEWIAEATGYELSSINNADSIDLKKYDAIVIGSMVLMNKPFLAGWIVEKWEHLSHAKVALFSASGTPGGALEIIKGYQEAIPEEIRNKLTYFSYQGRMDYRRLSVNHKLMMKIGAMIEKNPEAKAQMKHDMKNGVDGVNRENIAELVEWAKSAVAG